MSTGFGYYQIQAEIGRGGMGIVYRALDTRNEKTVAIKQLILENVDPEKHKEFTERFSREAETASRLSHPNIVKVLDVAEKEEGYYYVMEYLEGRSLRQELSKKGGQIGAAAFWKILKQVAEGLSYAHSLNVVHRDIKPDNIFILSDGRVVLTDFGIARIADLEATNITKTGVMLGTLAYVSPEQLQNAKKVDHRADIFSLGVVSYEALCGELPFTGDGIAATIVKIMSQEETPLHIIKPSISDELSATITRALRKKPRDRYRSVLEFMREYQKCMLTDSDEALDEESFDMNETSIDIKIDQSLITTSSGSALESTAQPMDDELEDENRQVSETVQSTAYSDLARGIKESRSEHNSKVPSGATSQELKPRRRLLRRADQPGTNSSSFGTTAAKPKQAPGSGYNPVRPKFVISESTNGESFIEPAVVAYRSGRIVVADIARRKAMIFNHEGRFISNLIQRPEFSNSNTGGGLLTKPSGIDIDERGRIYLCDSSDHYVRIFDNQGGFLKEFKNIKGSNGGLQGIAIDSTGLLYVSDSGNCSLQVFQSDVGVWVRELKRDEFQLPAGITTDRLNKIYVVDYGTSQVSVFNKSGALVRSFGKKGKDKGMFNVPRAVATDKQDRIYVLDSLNHRIQIFASSGDWLYTYGELGSDPGQFVGPSDLAIDNDNNLLFVADKGNRRIQVFELAFR